MAAYDINGFNLLQSVANIKDFGAYGDGEHDDSLAIQSALNNMMGKGGMIFFPSGTYLIGNSLIFYSNQVLLFDEGATILQGAGIDNLLRSYCDGDITSYNGTHDCLIIGGTFDGGTYTTSNSLVGIAHAKNITFQNCIFKNAYGTWHNLEINSSYNVKVIDCDFEGSRKTGVNGEMIQIDGAGSSGYYPWDNINIDNTVSKYVEICGCIFHDSTLVPGIGNHSNMAHKFTKVHDCIFDGLTSTRGAINFVSSMTDIDIYNNTFNGCDTGIGSSGATYYIHDNRFVDATTAISGSTSVAHNNMINGTYTP